jgi:hypothetical protein
MSLPFLSQLRLRPSGGYASWEVLARWRWRLGQIVATSEKEVVLAVTLVREQWPLFNSLHSQTAHILQQVIMLPLEVVGPGGSLSVLLMPRFFGGTPVGGPGSRQRQLRHTVATGRQQRSSLAGGWLAAATAEQVQSLIHGVGL